MTLLDIGVVDRPVIVDVPPPGAVVLSVFCLQTHPRGIEKTHESSRISAALGPGNSARPLPAYFQIHVMISLS